MKRLTRETPVVRGHRFIRLCESSKGYSYTTIDATEERFCFVMVKSSSQEICLKERGTTNGGELKTSVISVSSSNDVIDYSSARKSPQISAAFAAALGGYNVGCNESWSSPVQPQIQLNETLSEDGSVWDVRVTEEEMSWIGSLVNIGALLGSLFGGLLMDKYGRKTTLMAVSVPYIIGWLFITFAVHPSMLYIGRIICGLASGICTTAVPCYIDEISTPTVRGVVGVLFTITTCLGFLLASALAWLEWRWISCILGLQSIVMLLAVAFIPESPPFLVKKGRLAEARSALLWLRGPEFNREAELAQIAARNLEESKRLNRFSDLFRPWVLKPVLIGLAMMVFMHFSGYAVAEFYSIEIFRIAASSISPKNCALILNSVQVLAASLASALLVERFGRRMLFLASELFTLLSLIALGVYFYLQKHDQETATTLGWLPLASLISFIIAINIGIVPLSWVVSNEVLPNNFKGLGSSIVSFFDWVFCFVITKTFVDLQFALGVAGTFWFYAIFCFLGILFGLFLLPETKDRSVDEIQALLQKKVCSK